MMEGLAGLVQLLAVATVGLVLAALVPVLAVVLTTAVTLAVIKMAQALVVVLAMVAERMLATVAASRGMKPGSGQILRSRNSRSKTDTTAAPPTRRWTKR